jgi:hypothetical protein
MNRRTFVQRLSAAVLAAQSMESIAKVFRAEYCNTSFVQEMVERARKGDAGEITHLFGYSYGNKGMREPFEEARHQVDVANRIFGAAPITVLASRGRDGDDSIQAMFTYTNERRFIYRSMVSRSQTDDQLWIYGNKGTLNLTLRGKIRHMLTEPDSSAAVVAANYSLRKGRELDLSIIG